VKKLLKQWSLQIANFPVAFAALSAGSIQGKIPCCLFCGKLFPRLLSGAEPYPDTGSATAEDSVLPKTALWFTL